MLHVRPAIAKDTAAICALIGAVYAEYGCTLNVEEDEPHLREPGAYFRARGGEFWVVEDEEGIRATVAVQLHTEGAAIQTPAAAATATTPAAEATPATAVMTAGTGTTAAAGTTTAELKSLYVHPSLRRQGWGRRLAELAIDYARRAGASTMFLWSDTRFVEAHRLYRRMGFRPCGRRDLHDSNNSVEFGFDIAIKE